MVTVIRTGRRFFRVLDWKLLSLTFALCQRTRLALVAVGLALTRQGWRRSTMVDESHAGPDLHRGPSSNLMSSLPSLIKSSIVSGRVTPRPRGTHCHVPGRSRGSRNYTLSPLPHRWPYGPEQLFSLLSKAFFIFSNPTTFSSVFGKEEKKSPA